jgi:hypothetical protein
MCMGRGICDHTDWTMDEENYVFIAAQDIADCPDFELNTDHISEVVAEEVMLLDPEMYGKVHAVFELPDKLGIRIFLKKNLLDDYKAIKEMLDETAEAVEYLSKGTIGIQNMRIQIDFAFESEDNLKIPNCLPANIEMEAGSKCPMEDEDPESGWEDEEEDEWEDEEEDEEGWKGE